MTSYASHVSTRQTPQSEPIPGKNMVKNSAGGYSHGVDCWTRLDRFLILGNEGGSYYANEKKLTQENAQCVRECFKQDPDRTIARIVEISDSGRAVKNDPAIFALAMLSKDGRALDAVNKVCRIGTHLFQFIDDAQHFRGRGRAFKRCLQNWYLSKSDRPRDLAYQAVKYQQRNGWSHRDVLRLCKPKTSQGDVDCILSWIAGKPKEINEEHDVSLAPIHAFEAAKKATSAKEIVSLIENYDLVRECIPTQFLNEPSVWEALLQKMPLMAMIRNLGKMSNVGLLTPMSQACATVEGKLGSEEAIMKSRLHPVSLLMASRIYQAGRGLKGSLNWNPDSNIMAALDAAFISAFGNVQPSNKRHLLALDVSGSMGCNLHGTFLTCRDASAAMAMVAVKTEPTTHTVGFTGDLTVLPFTRNDSLNAAVNHVSGLPFGGTDCALPMLHALKNNILVDVFSVYTDSETWTGSIQPCQALQQYRDKMGINAKLVVVGMVSSEFTIADPNDPGMMDVVGFDTAAPSVISDFARD